MEMAMLNERVERFGHHWTRGRPKKEQATARSCEEPKDQFTPF